MAPIPVRRCRPLLGTLVEVAAEEEHASAIDLAFTAIECVQAAMSFHEDGSDLGRLRRAPAGRTVRVGRDTVTVLRLAERLYRRTGGLFDVTFGRVLIDDGFLPDPPGLDLRRIGWGADAIEIVGEEEVRCREPRLIDLGGIAKGFAVDQAIAALDRAGVPHALVNAGGDLRVLGDAPQPIHLRAADGRLEGVLMLADAALASSSNLHDRHTVRGRIAVPHRGRGGTPAPFADAVTVAAPTCMLADAMTKLVLADRDLARDVLREEGAALVERPATRAAA